MKPSIPAGRLHQILSAKERPTRGFTLPELLVVVGTLAVLSLFLVPALAGTRTDTCRLLCWYNPSGNTLFIPRTTVNGSRGWKPHPPTGRMPASTRQFSMGTPATPVKASLVIELFKV